MTTSTQSWYGSIESQMKRANAMVLSAARRWRETELLLQRMLADHACEQWHEDIRNLLQDVER